MPGKGPGPSIKNPKAYEALKRKGFSKSSAAAISNAQAEDEEIADGALIEWLGRDKEFSAARRKTLAKQGKAMAHGGYPIENKGDLKNAIHAFGRAKNKAATKAWIKKRARALGATEMLPENWDSLTGKGTGGVYDQWMATTDTKVCPRCDGEGILSNGEVCPTCEGHGNVEPAQPYVQGVGPAGEVNVRLAVPSAHMGINNTGGSGTGGEDDKLLRTLARHVAFSRKVKSLMSGQGLPPNLEADALPPQFTCPACHGTGKDPDADSELPGGRCDACGGSGYIDSPDDNKSHWREDPGPYPVGNLDRKRDDDDDDDDDTRDSVRMQDSIQLVVDKDGIHKSRDGYMAISARIARTGIQLYDGSELGRPDMGVVRVYRPPEEVFSASAMHSLAHKPVTLDHPPMMVDADNWKDYAIGHIGDEVTRDGDTVRVPMVLMDGKAIRAYEQDGIRELSVGYSTELKWGEGKTPAGETYDAIQTAIRGNHLAVVSAARGGSQLRIGDDHQKGDHPMVNMLVDGRLVEFSNEQNAKHVTDYIGKLQQQIADWGKKSKDGDNAEEEQEEEKKTRGAKDAELASLKGENVALKKQLEDAQAKSDPKAVEDRAKQHIDLLLKADAAMDGKGNFDGMSAEQIRREVVQAKLGDAAKDLDDAQMIGAFKAVTANLKPRSGTDRLADSLGLLGQGGGGGNQNSPQALRDAAYQEYVARQQNAWKTRSA